MSSVSLGAPTGRLGCTYNARPLWGLAVGRRKNMVGLRIRGHVGLGGNMGAPKGYASFMEDMSDPVPGWQESAGCQGKPSDWFTYEGPASGPDLIKGVTVCGDCPVRSKCLEESSDTDRHWTVRGGYFPAAFKSATQRHSSTGSPAELADLPNKDRAKQGKSCRNGHSPEWSRDKAGKWRCRACQRASRKEFLIRNSEKGLAGKPDRPCKRGHEDWRVNNTGTGYQVWRCHECALISRRKSRAAAKM